MPDIVRISMGGQPLNDDQENFGGMYGGGSELNIRWVKNNPALSRVTLALS